jgi:hypothetical protein
MVETTSLNKKRAEYKFSPVKKSKLSYDNLLKEASNGQKVAALRESLPTFIYKPFTSSIKTLTL